MNPKIQTLTQIEVPGLDGRLDFRRLEDELDRYIESLLPRINVQDLRDWRLTIKVTARRANGVGVFKRVLRYPGDQEFVASISIGVPDETQAPYGLGHPVKASFFHPMQPDKFTLVPVDWQAHADLAAYITAAARAAIDAAFATGLTCHGIKIRLMDR